MNAVGMVGRFQGRSSFKSVGELLLASNSMKPSPSLCNSSDYLCVNQK